VGVFLLQWLAIRSTMLIPLALGDPVVESSPDQPWITRAQAIAIIGITALAAVAAWVIALQRAVRLRTYQIRESEQKFATAFRASPDAIVITRLADGVFLEVNDGFCQLTDFTREQVIGRSTLDLSWLGQADRNRMLEEMRRAGCVRDYPADVRDAAGHTHQVVISSTPVEVGGEQCLLSIVRDVTEQHRAESVIRNERLFTDTMIESMPGILYFYDAQGRFLRWNRSFETVSGYSAAEIARMHPLDFFSDEEKPLLAQRIAAVFETGAAFVEASFVAKDGTATPYYFTGRRVMFNDAPCLVGIGIDISERQKAQQLLAESERKYRELVEHANSIILRWTPEGRITFLNEFGQRFFGYTAEEIIGRHVMDTIVPPRESTGRDLRNLMQQVCADPKAFEQNVNENICRDGTHVWIAWTNRIVFDAWGKVIEILSIGSDITARRRAEQALAASERKFATLFHMSPMALALSTQDSLLLDVNQAFADLYGIPRNELIGQRSVDVPSLFTGPEERAALLEMLIRDGRIRNLERTRTRRDGSTITTVSAAELIELDGSMHILTAVVDVSQQKQAQELLHESNIALERRVAERTQELEAANQELEAFCYSVSHDLRAPLRSIDGFCQAVLEDYAPLLDDTGKNYLTRVRVAARRMSELIDDLLTLSRIARSSMHRELVDLSALAAEVLADLRQSNPTRPVSVTIAPGLSVCGDKNLLRVLLDNLLGNAWKYTSRTADPKIEFGCEEGSGGAVFYVRDNGAGFDPAYAHKLFLPFQRLHRADEFPGHGVGLATVQRIVRRHGGTVMAEGSVGHGATFRFTIPSGAQDPP